MQGSGKPKKQHVTPSIDLGSPVKRAWVLVQWHDLHLGDLVTDHGTVREIDRRSDGVFLLFDHEQRFVPITDEEEVFAFVEIDA